MRTTVEVELFKKLSVKLRNLPFNIFPEFLHFCSNITLNLFLTLTWNICWVFQDFMRRVKFSFCNGGIKPDNISLTSREEKITQFIHKTERFIKRMKWYTFRILGI